MYVARQPQIVNSIDRPELARGGRRVHYLHVPKCGGTTLRYVLEAYAATRGLTVANEARRVEGVSPDPGAAEVAMGHVRPADGLGRGDTCYVTLLRNPVGRLRSLVAMRSSRTGRPHEAVIGDIGWTEANWAVHLLSGATGPGGDAVLEAKQALATRVHVFGFQERMAEFMALLATTLEVGGLIYPSFQYTPSDLQVDRAFDATFKAMTAADRELFDYARTLYGRRFAPLLSGAEAGRGLPGRTYLRIRLEESRAHVDASEIRFAP